MASQELQAWGTSMMGIGLKIAAAGALIAAPFIAGFHHFVQAGSDMQDMADRTGLTVEALSELRHAVEQAGASAEDLEKGLKAMDQFLVNVAAGSPAAIDSLDRLGLRFEDLNKLTRDQALSLFADALSGVDNASLRSTLAIDVFGRSALRLMPLLRSGSSGIRELREEAGRLGLVMSAADAAAAESLGDQLANLVKIAKMVAFTFGAAVAPIIRVFVGVAMEAAVAVNHFMTEHKELMQVIFAVGLGILAVGGAIVSLGAVVWAVGGAFGVLYHAFHQIEGVMAIFTTATGGVQLALAQYSAAIAGHFIPVLKHVAHAFLAIRLSILAVSLAQAAWGYITAGAAAVGAMALSAYALVATFVGSGFGVLTVATWAWGAASATASGIATAAIAVYASTISVLKALLTGFGALQFLIWLGAATKTMIASAALAVYAAMTGPATGGTLLLSVAEAVATVATTVLTAGVNLLIGAIVVLSGVVVAAAVAIGLVALAVVAFVPTVAAVTLAIQNLFDWLDQTTDAVIEFGRSLIMDPFEGLLNSARALYDFVTGTFLGIWRSISDAVDSMNDAFADGDIRNFATYLAYAAIGVAAVVGGFVYLAYNLPAAISEAVSAIADVFGAVFDFLMSGNMLERFAMAAIDQLQGVIDFVAGVATRIGGFVGEVFGAIVAPFVAAGNWIVGVFRSVVGFFAGAVRQIGAWADTVVGLIVAPFVLAGQMIRDLWSGLADYLSSKILEAIQMLLAPFVRLGRQLVGTFLEATTAIRDALASAGANTLRAFSGILPALRGIWASATSAAGTIGAAFVSAFGGIFDMVGRTWDAIQNSFNAGNWDGIWEVLQISAGLAWAHISTLASETWLAMKFGATEIFYSLADSLADVFDGVWFAMKDTFLSVWSAIKAAAFKGLADIVNAMSRISPMAHLVLSGQEQSLRDQAAQAATGDAARRQGDAAGRASGAIGAWFGRQMEAVNREMLQEELLEARRAGDQAEIDRLTNELAIAQTHAEELAVGAGPLFRLPSFGGPPGMEVGGRAMMIGGGISFGALQGALGASGESPAQRTERLQQRQIDEIARLRELIHRDLQEVRREAGARIG
jgi:hypothetical protein